MQRRVRVVVAMILALASMPAVGASCELVDGLGSVAYRGDGATSEDGSPSDAGLPEGGSVEGGPDFCAPAGDACPGLMVLVNPGEAGCAFCIDRTEVTNAAFAKFTTVVTAGDWDASALCNDADLLATPTERGASDPVTNVTWCGAYEYCRSIHGRLCSQETLPGQVDDWTLACNAGGRVLRPYGDAAIDGRCNLDHADGAPGPVPYDDGSCQGGYPGIYDMLGNVAEWGGVCSLGSDASCRVRGGAYLSPDDTTCASGYGFAPTERHPYIGFRCCGRPAPMP
jgi:formylglycine-generating enzyme